MFGNHKEFSVPSQSALTEQEMLTQINELLLNEHSPAPTAPLQRKLHDFIVTCGNKALLQPLSEHHRVDVRCAVASNRQLPEELVWKLACDGDSRVRLRLADNPSLASFVLETLAEDEDDHVSLRASKTLERLNSERLTDKVIHWMFGSTTMRQTG